MQGTNPDGPVNYWGSYTSGEHILDIERRVANDCYLQLSAKFIRVVNNEESRQLIWRFHDLRDIRIII
jgi:hypothetical protein